MNDQLTQYDYESEADYAVRLLRHELRDVSGTDFDAWFNPALTEFRMDVANLGIARAVDYWRSCYTPTPSDAGWLADQLDAIERMPSPRRGASDSALLGPASDRLYHAVKGGKP